MQKIIAVGLMVTLLAPGRPARGDERADVSDAGDSDKAVRERIEFIEDRLDSERRHAQLWYWSWMTVFSVATVGLSIDAANEKESADRINSISQAALAAGGIGDLLLFRPMDARFGADQVRRLPEGTAGERQQKLERAEAQLRANAERALSRTDWRLHLINFAANSAVGLLVWAAGDGKTGAISAVSGVIAGEAYFWTEPGGPARDLADYERFRSGQSVPGTAGWRIVPAPNGVALQFRF